MPEETTTPLIARVDQPYHALLFGDPGGGKSHMAASGDLPQAVLMSDGSGKARPYLDGMIARRRMLPIKLNTGNTELEMIQVYHPSDVERKNIQRLIFNFVDKNAKEPMAWKQFEGLFPIIDTYMNMIRGKTLVLDSITTLQILYRNFAEKDLGGFKTEWDWMNPVTTRFEQICMDLIAKPYNTVVIAHVSLGKSTQHGYSEYVTSFPGRMAAQALALHDNSIRVYVDRDGSHWAQCKNDGVYATNNNVNAPQRCENTFKDLMKNQTKIIWED